MSRTRYSCRSGGWVILRRTYGIGSPCWILISSASTARHCWPAEARRFTQLWLCASYPLILHGVEKPSSNFSTLFVFQTSVRRVKVETSLLVKEGARAVGNGSFRLHTFGIISISYEGDVKKPVYTCFVPSVVCTCLQVCLLGAPTSAATASK